MSLIADPHQRTTSNELLVAVRGILRGDGNMIERVHADALEHWLVDLRRADL